MTSFPSLDAETCLPERSGDDPAWGEDAGELRTGHVVAVERPRGFDLGPGAPCRLRVDAVPGEPDGCRVAVDCHSGNLHVAASSGLRRCVTEGGRLTALSPPPPARRSVDVLAFDAARRRVTYGGTAPDPAYEIELAP